MDHTKDRIALPSHVSPKNYKIRIEPDLVACTFTVQEEISVVVKQEVKEIVANAKDLKFSSAAIEANGSRQVATVTLDEKNEKVTFTVPNPIKPGEAVIHASFTGELNDKLKGFYRSKYTVNKEDRFMGVTQFEPTDARRSLVCWDEPNVKSTFDVTVVVPNDRLAISNMPVTSEKPVGDKKKEVTFARTPIMSIYLLAYIVGEFDFVEDKTPNGVTVRVYTPLGKREQGQFALQVAVKTLPFYDQWFGIPYPLPKMDLLAIPDFAAGAMENWGCVTYRETALLVDPQNSSAATKQWVALVVGHELAHQWFGNLVTMDWWTHLWLNEGFASWIEYLCVDHCFPEWDIWTQFVYSDTGRALSLDALSNSHPVEVPINDPAEIDEIFDAISYSKGCAIIRMLHNWVGNDKFKLALNKYLHKFQYQNAITEDLWESIGEASGKPVKELMDTWTKKTGYPVLTITGEHHQHEAHGHGHHAGKHERTFEFTQERFLSTGPVPSDHTTWMIPVGVISSTHPQPVYDVLKEKSGKITIGAGHDDWVKFNPGQTGFYRVRYPSSMLPKLRHAIEHHLLSPVDRLGVENDILSLAKAGFVPIAEALDVVKSFRSENNYTVWADLSSKLAELETIISNTEYYDQWRDFARQLYSKVAAQVGWDAKANESHSTSLLRSLVLAKVGKYGDAAVVAEAKKRFDALIASPGSNAVVADLRSCVYTTVLAAHSTTETFDALLKLFRAADSQEEKVRLMRSLGSARDETLLQRTLEFAMTDEVRSQDAVFVLQAVSANPKGRDLAWKFVQNRWADLRKKYDGGFLISRLISVPGDYASEDRAKEVEAFFQANPVPGTDRTVKQTVESIRSNAKWLERDREHIKTWLAKHGQF